MRFPTLVPTFRSIARNIVDDPVAEDVALSVDHRLYRESAQFDDHLVAWGSYLVAKEALERAAAGAPSPLSDEQRAALATLPAAALTVVVLRDGPGFSNDAISIAVDRPLHEVQWLSDRLPGRAFATVPTGPTAPAAPAPAPQAPTATPEAEPAASAVRVSEVTVSPIDAEAIAKQLKRQQRSKRRVWKAIGAVILLLGLAIVGSALLGRQAADERKKAPTSGTVSEGAVATVASNVPQLSTAGCDVSPPIGVNPIPPSEISLGSVGLANTATVRAAVGAEGPRPMIIAFVPAGLDTSQWLLATRLEALAASNGAILLTLTAADPSGWAIPAGRELTADLEGLSVALMTVGGLVCVDSRRVSMVGFGDAADFATTVSCLAPTVANHLVVIGGGVPGEACSRFDGRGLLAVLAGANPDYDAAVLRYSEFITERACPQPSYTNVGLISLAQSGPCERDARFWIGAASTIEEWTGEYDDIVTAFLTASGALAPL